MDPIGPENLERLLTKHGGALVLYARQWTAAAEDVVQEALLQLVRQRRAPENVVGWLYRAVRNGAISAARSQRRRQQRRLAALGGQPWFKPSDGASLDAEAAARALEALPIEERETVVARLWGGLTFSEIAKLTGTSSSTAARRYQAALAAMRERLRVKCVETKNSRPN